MLEALVDVAESEVVSEAYGAEEALIAEQEAGWQLFDEGVVEQQYSERMQEAVEEKQSQLERLEEALKERLEGRLEEMEESQRRKPGRISLPRTKREHEERVAHQRTSVDRTRQRLERIESFDDHERLQRLAAQRLQRDSPELVRAMMELREARRAEALRLERAAQRERELQHRAGRGRGQSLTRD